MRDLWAALCLVAVIEGLFLFAAPAAWKRTAAQMLTLTDAQVRRVGGVVLLLGLLALWLVRGSG
ncbi:DUF2065 domain-containing protein [Thermomonas hydrothermalis]|jgi:uncharacterized protein YjeT (DUF2065 family)|uniref:DUF2065 domain-containing protein n=1 Tax=Thermomonas hydrothermalis TaxID=213588 RepID=A0A1M4YSA0_9GAMM|nr:DUF2065 family protein [Thermomonas hydrothermalis]MCL6619688.1 DUF2065 family protein [Thermomonas hydrothermalis]SHF08226.1 hypothetical protein SAMN02745204_01751 [Thermomonas hydrothermalis]